jgi:hypothetical protein
MVLSPTYKACKSINSQTQNTRQQLQITTPTCTTHKALKSQLGLGQHTSLCVAKVMTENITNQQILCGANILNASPDVFAHQAGGTTKYCVAGTLPGAQGLGALVSTMSPAPIANAM